jgi:predicted DsbA family dithiol-disulfide isomerase
MARAGCLEIPVYYDFASSLCYVSHRVMERLGSFLGDTDCELVWYPIDLARLLGWPRRFAVPEPRLQHVRGVARELSVPLKAQPYWQDSRRANSAALLLGERDRERGSCREATWRERIFSLVYEQGRSCDDHAELAAIAGELGLGLSEPDWETAVDRLESATREAHALGVTGVPTFMLGGWPFAGIQSDDTMRSILGRYAARSRARAAG